VDYFVFKFAPGKGDCLVIGWTCKYGSCLWCENKCTSVGYFAGTNSGVLWLQWWLSSVLLWSKSSWWNKE